MMTLFYILLPVYVAFCLWLGVRILRKAGFDGWWVLVLSPAIEARHRLEATAAGPEKPA